jgi:hypothetical protein
MTRRNRRPVKRVLRQGREMSFHSPPFPLLPLVQSGREADGPMRESQVGLVDQSGGRYHPARDDNSALFVLAAPYAGEPIRACTGSRSWPGRRVHPNARSVNAPQGCGSHLSHAGSLHRAATTSRWRIRHFLCARKNRRAGARLSEGGTVARLAVSTSLSAGEQGGAGRAFRWPGDSQGRQESDAAGEDAPAMPERPGQGRR